MVLMYKFVNIIFWEKNLSICRCWGEIVESVGIIVLGIYIS